MDLPRLEEIEEIAERINIQNDELDVNFLIASVIGIILTNSDEDEELGPVVWVKVTVDVDEYRFMEDAAFRLHFRMSREIFEELVTVVGNSLVAAGRRQREGTNIAHILLMVVWILATPDCFRSVALRFGVTPGVLHYNYKVMIAFISGLAHTYTAWPGQGEREVIERHFEQDAGFPGVVGAVDGTHVFISEPTEESAKYFNRHHCHSILLQAVCDNNMVFRDIYVGEPGSLHDSRVFRRSPLSSLLLQDDRLLSQDQHILGDGAYILTDKVLTPFRNMGNLTEAQRWYNVSLSSLRVVIERAFGLLKGKWRRLKYMQVVQLEYAVQHIVACCVLHNFVILNGEPLDENIINAIQAEPQDPVDEALAPEEEHPNIVVEPDNPLLEAARNRGVEKRLHMVDILFNRL